ncbi:hypothetical protein D3C72_1690730 [compost metagenome]
MAPLPSPTSTFAVTVRAPAFALSKEPLADSDRFSPFTRPTKVPALMLATFVRSYVLLAAPMPAMLSTAGVIDKVPVL